MVEPLEETRNELIFATEPLLSSLALAIPGSSRNLHLVELDEIEVRNACAVYIPLEFNLQSDTKGNTANLQGTFLLAFIRQIDPLKHIPGECHNQ
jgi:hypothetical protein